MRIRFFLSHFFTRKVLVLRSAKCNKNQLKQTFVPKKRGGSLFVSGGLYPKQTLIPYPAISMLDRKWCSKTSPHLSLCKNYGKFDRKFSWTARRNLKSLFVCVGFFLQILCHKTLISYETARALFVLDICISCAFLH